MDDTNLVKLEMTITYKQVRYLRRKFREWSNNKLKQAKRDKSVSHYEESIYFQDHIMLESFIQMFDV